MEAGKIELVLPDGSRRVYNRGVIARDVVADIGRRLSQDAIAVKLNGQTLELFRPLNDSGDFVVLTWNDEDGRYCLRHTAAHIVAQAVKRLFPDASLAIGPPIEDGFYYDIDLEHSLTPEDLEAIEAEVERIVAEDLQLERFELDRSDAIRLMAERGEPYKVELIQDLADDEAISFYRQGEFIDLCRGPHANSTGRIRAIKLLNVAGAYWRGDESRPMLQRIYGTAFDRREDLEQFLWRREEARRRDHRRLGPALDLFHFDDVAPGYAFWHPKGTIVYNELLNFSRQLQAGSGYQEVRTPDILKADLWHISGHWQHFRDNMFLIERDESVFGVKPMNCPGHALIFKSKTRSYRDLPLRMAEYGHLARYERSGVLHGLLRVRGFVQDDAHLFVREDQIEEEIGHCLALIDQLYARTFEMEYEVDLSTRPESFMGAVELWDRAEAMLAAALTKTGRPYRVGAGEGSYYGPKLDFHVLDSLGRRWQCATVQLDFQMPQRFDLTYTGEDGREHRPVMIHRAIMGTLERFIGILIEHFAGAFPTWLAPVQVRVIPVADSFAEYAENVRRQLAANGLRVEVDGRGEKVGWKIRQAQLDKVPYMLVVGQREAESGSVAVRHRDHGDVGVMPIAEFSERVGSEVRLRSARAMVAAD